MRIEDVVLISTVREDIRHHALQVDSHEIPRCIEAAQAGMHAIASGRHGAFASEGAKDETLTKPSPSNGTERSAQPITAAVASATAVANNMTSVGGEDEDDGKSAVASSPVDVKRGSWGRDDASGGGGSHSTGSVEVRPSERERSSRPSSAWGKILVVPSPTVSHSPSTSAWGTADPPESHDPPPPAWPGGRGPSGWGSAHRSISVLNIPESGDREPLESEAEARRPPQTFGVVRRSEF
jgi:hypothetical protein